MHRFRHQFEALSVETGGQNGYEPARITEIAFYNVLSEVIFNFFFEAPGSNPQDVVLLFDNQNKCNGFGVVCDLSVTTGGTFRRDLEAYEPFLLQVGNIRHQLRGKHSDATVVGRAPAPTTLPTTTNGLTTYQVNVLRFRSWITLKGFLDFFQMCGLCYDFKVVTIFCSQTVRGFGFLQISHISFGDNRYLNGLRADVHNLKLLIWLKVTESVRQDILAQCQRQQIDSVTHQPTTAPTTFQTGRQQLYGNIHDPVYGGPSNTDSGTRPLRARSGRRLAPDLPYPSIRQLPSNQGNGTRQGETNEMIPYRSTDSLRDAPHVSYRGSTSHNPIGRFAGDHQRIGSTDMAHQPTTAPTTFQTGMQPLYGNIHDRVYDGPSYRGSTRHNPIGRFAGDHQRTRSTDMAHQGVRTGSNDKTHQGVRIGPNGMTGEGGRNDKITYTTQSTLPGPNSTDAVTTCPVTAEFATPLNERWPPLSVPEQKRRRRNRMAGQGGRNDTVPCTTQSTDVGGRSDLNAPPTSKTYASISPKQTISTSTTSAAHRTDQDQHHQHNAEADHQHDTQ